MVRISVGLAARTEGLRPNQVPRFLPLAESAGAGRSRGDKTQCAGSAEGRVAGAGDFVRLECHNVDRWTSKGAA